MRKRSIEVAVGIFVIMGMMALLMLALRVSGLNEIYTAEQGYSITANFENVGGLKVRSRVSLAGVPIGRVTDISFDNTEYVAKVTMFLKKGTQLPIDSEFSILTSGFLGDNYVGVKAGLENEFLAQDSQIDVVSTHKAVVLEELISKFLANSGNNAPNQPKE